LVAALVIASAASVASAANAVWFSGTVASGPGGGGPGGEGSILDLTCDTTGPAGTCSYNITMSVNGDDAVGLIAFASNLSSSSASDSAANPAIAAGNPFNSAPLPGTPGAGPGLLSGAQGQTFGAPLTGTANLITFTLNHAFVSGDLGVSLITESATDGSTGVVWAGGDGNYAQVSVGGGPAIEHSEGTIGGVGIRITNVPEPTTLGLLIIGGLALIRRR
jgi:hypothetical protein